MSTYYFRENIGGAREGRTRGAERVVGRSAVSAAVGIQKDREDEKMKQIRSSNLGSTFRQAIYLLLLVGLIYILVGCTPWRSQFLGESINRATASDVASKLGTPAFTHRLDTGEEVWTYRYDSVNDCIEYIVRFDSGKILRDWSSNVYRAMLCHRLKHPPLDK
jgi:hypothetical protein